MSTEPTFASIGPMPFESLLTELASKSPTPGGGAAAGLVGASAAALAGMVVAYSIGRKSLAEHRTFLEDAGRRLARAREIFLVLADEDAASYARLNALMRLEEDHPDRLAGWESAVRQAIAPPRAMLASANDLLRLCEELIGRTNPHLKSDLAVAAVQAEAAARSAAWNVDINVPLLPDPDRARIPEETNAAVLDAKARAARVEAGCV
ncbi:MAG: cyclodeaminase/cyclohydrolase family protein [Planctomycetota bacterium]